MDEKILIVKKEPGKEPHVDFVENTLEAFQDAVGGYIEVIKIATDFALVVNEEGRLHGMQKNMTFLGVDIVGPVIVVGVQEEEFVSIKSSVVPFAIRMLKNEKQDD